jgi:hypothetical protein
MTGNHVSSVYLAGVTLHRTILMLDSYLFALERSRYVP